MRFASVSAALALMVAGAQAQSTTVPVTGLLGNASVVSDNPIGPTYAAILPKVEYFNPVDPRGNIKGSVVATAASGGKGVAFQVNFSNLPTSGGPFLYHIHAAPVNSSGNCLSTLAHLDPTMRGEMPSCDAALPQTCQVGDLSGKYGKITSDPFHASYVDPYASLVPGLDSFFGNLSITVHFANTTRITCASFALLNANTTAGGGGGANTTATSTSSSTATAPPPKYTNGAAGLTASLLSLFVAGFATLII
ncbi:MAG: hypothetical protein M1818_001027 [Claussenomyces sp. TS43310]|nr:MAG: hypothetical protein M1818_001027 [Claussenomyces sp. TS43310]